MTYADYIKLWNDLATTDSISQKKVIMGMIEEAAKELCHRLVALYEEYGMNYVSDSDYCEDRGRLVISNTLKPDAHIVYLNYTDSWCRGGYCDIDIDVKMKYLDDDEFGLLRAKVRRSGINNANWCISSNNAKIEELTKKNAELTTRRDRWLEERDNDPNTKRLNELEDEEQELDFG